jgi:uncharacterized protein (TIGR02145 family)
MKKTLPLILVFFCALALYSQDPSIKFYLNDGSQEKEYKIKDITEMNFIKSNLSYSMEIFVDGSINTYNVEDIISIELVDSTKLKINLLSSSENINIADLDSIIFITTDCTEILIGTQTWMCRNLDVDHYRNGDEIPQVKDPSIWANFKKGAWCYYNNDPTLGAIYGKLYNWYAVNDPRGLAPDGWHIPSDAEWITLSTYLGGESIAGGKLKSIGTIEAGDGFWHSPNKSATNETGFSALPGDYRCIDGVFNVIGSYGYWWSSTEANKASAWNIHLNSFTSSSYRDSNYKYYGQAIRCVKDSKYTPPKINSIKPNSASIGAEILIIGTSFGNKRDSSVVSFNEMNVSEYTSWSDTEIKVNVPVGAQTGKVSVTVNNLKSNGVVFPIKSNITGDYESIPIGTQTWMFKNLDVAHYRNGDSIPQVTDRTEWANLTTGAWCYYMHTLGIGAVFGKLYNWYAVNDPRGLAPEGWHIPSDEEWTTLSTFLGGEILAGGKLKSTGTFKDYGSWYSPNTGATNETGFSALPGGKCDYYKGSFIEYGEKGYWWSSTGFNATKAWSLSLYYFGTNLYRFDNYKGCGFSVRCIKD